MKMIKMVAATFENKEEGDLNALEALLNRAISEGAPRNAQIGIAASDIPEVVPTISIRWEIEKHSGEAVYQSLANPKTEIVEQTGYVVVGPNPSEATQEFLKANPHLEPHEHTHIDQTKTCEICNRKVG